MTFQPSNPSHFRLLQPTVARQNRLFGIALTKDSKYRKAVDKASKYEDKYRKCKAKRLGKGKQAWPVDKGNALSGNCKHDYERWQHWEGKAADRARTLKEKLEKKGKLDPGMAEELNQAMVAPSKAAKAEYEKDKANWEKAGKGKGGKGAKGGGGAPPAEEDYTEEAAADYTIPILAIGGLLLLGGGAFILLRKKKPVPASVPVPVAV
jgi:LPXTG-motif cell wall-anchored protein